MGNKETDGAILYKNVLLNEYGYYTLKNPPTEEECESFYRDIYTYRNPEYTKQELDFINAKLEQKYLLAKQHCNGSSFLDIGCGKGFALAFFKKMGFSVLGLDYGQAGIENYNSELSENVIFGDLYKSIDNLISCSEYFDIVNLDHVLEHVVNPKLLLEKVKRLLAKSGIVIIRVPNDFSFLQKHFFDNKIVKKPHWVVYPDHISYFNKDGLINLCKAAGFNCVDFLADQLIEFSALNPLTNYYENKSVGSSCHIARVAQENIFHSISPQKTIELFRIFGEMNLGREITGVFRASPKNR